jgi:hypothetical protein
MTTTTEPTIREEGRSLRASWSIGHDDEGEVFAVLSVTHHGKAEYMGQIEKCYDARLSHETLIDRGGYTMRKVTIGIGYRTDLLIGREHAARYSAKRAREFFDRMLAEVEAGRSEGGNIAAMFELG